MSWTLMRTALVILLAAALTACARRMPEAPAIQPSLATSAPTPTVAPKPTEPPAGISALDITPGELGTGFKASITDRAVMENASSGYDKYFSDFKAFGFVQDAPDEVIGIYIGKFLDEAARAEMDRTIDAYEPEDIAPEGTTGGPFMMDEVGDNSLGFTGVSDVSNGFQWHADALFYRDGDIFVRLGVSYQEGTKPAVTTEEIIALIAKHIAPIRAAK